MITVTNPNPGTLGLWRGAVLQDVLKPHDQLEVPLTEDLRLTYSGRSKARVVLSIKGTGDEAFFADGPAHWVQEVGPKPVRPDPEHAIDESRRT